MNESEGGGRRSQAQLWRKSMSALATMDGHSAGHCSPLSALLQPPPDDMIRVGSRRWFLQTGIAGVAGLSLPSLLARRATGSSNGPAGDRKAVILFWLSGGPSQIDMWDPKPD